MSDLSGVKSRKWLITINNPNDHGFTHDVINEKFSAIKGSPYWCLCDEIGDECETLHTHIYFYRSSPFPADQLNRMFPNMHRDIAFGKSCENRAYVRKEGDKYNKQSDGSYEYTDSTGKLHKGTNFIDTFEEYGEMPEEYKRKTADMVIDLIKSGSSDIEIMEQVPSSYTKLEEIRQVRSVYRAEPFKDKWRELEVTYIFGTPGSGKSRSVMDKYGYSNVYRVTDYKHAFDGYDGQDIIIFEEYRHQFPVANILTYLEGYPLELPCRYHNKYACYTKAFIISNVPPDEQYPKEHKDTIAAFYRRIQKVVEHRENNRIEYAGVQEYLKNRG